MGPRGASSCDVPSPPSSTGAVAAETYGAATAATVAETSGATAAATADVSPPTTSNDSDIRRTLDYVLTVQAAQGQILVDVLDEIHGLRADLA